jgi:hypothetical protein
MNFLARLVTGGAVSAAGAPIWLWIIGALLLANVAQEGVRRVQVGALHVQVADGRTALQTEKANREHERREAADATLEEARQNAAETLRRLNAQQENQRVQDAILAKNRADADRARAAADGLRLRAAAYLEAAGCGTATGDSAIACIRTAAAKVADALGQCGAIARAVAADADDARARGQLCERNYDSLTLKSSTP